MRHAMTLVVGLAVLMAAAAVRADWDLGDPHKMHYPQLPDPQGWDVKFNCPQILADDWGCKEPGPVSDVHFWLSMEADVEPHQPGTPLPFVIKTIHMSIHDNVPGAVGAYSHPGQLLWQRDFDDSSQFAVRWWGGGPQGWIDPVENVIDPSNPGDTPNHQNIYQVNIPKIERPFIQEGTPDEPRIYWLDLCVVATGPDGTEPVQLGWKTSLEHFMDDAVFMTPGVPVGWQPLTDPFTGETLHLAFVITPEPATLALLGLGAVGLVLRRRKR